MATACVSPPAAAGGADTPRRVGGPSVVFCNLVCSGSSAIDPILRGLLRDQGYDLVPFGPETSHRLREYAEHPRPIYHWTHDPVETFREFLPRPDYRFLFLYRDPRDVLVSWTKDHLHKRLFPEKTEREVLLMLLEHEMPRCLQIALEWLRLEERVCLPFRFEEMKEDMRGTCLRILDFLSLRCPSRLLDELIARFSFERVTGRARGADGPILRTGYMHRKGVAGEWRRCFDPETVALFKRHLGDYLLALGYESDWEW